MAVPSLKKQKQGNINSISTPVPRTENPKTDANETKSEKKERLNRHSAIAMLYFAMTQFQQILGQLPSILGYFNNKEAKANTNDDEVMQKVPQDSPQRTQLLKEFKELVSHFGRLLDETERLVEVLLREVSVRDPNNPGAQIQFAGGGAFSGINHAHAWPRPSQSRSCTPDELKEMLTSAQRNIDHYLDRIRGINDLFRQNGWQNTDGNNSTVEFEQRVNTIKQNIDTIFRTLDNPAAVNGNSSHNGAAADDPPGYDDPHFNANGAWVQPRP
ncbi:MAG: hypothetical protein ACHP9Y_01580 [Gammaproteobacteria bacterium]